mgnify:CR=1 FL=1
MKGKRILVVSQHYWPENFRITDICAGFAEDGCEVDVLCGLPNYPKGEWFEGYRYTGPRRESHAGVQIFRAGEIRRRGNTSLRIFLNYISFPVTALFNLPRLHGRKYDAVFCYETSPVLMMLPAVVYAKLHRVPLTTYVLDLWPENLYSVMPVRNKALRAVAAGVSHWFYRRSERLVAMSPALDERLAAIAPRAQRTVVPQYCEDLYAQDVHDAALESRFAGRFNVVFAAICIALGFACGLAGFREPAFTVEKTEGGMLFFCAFVVGGLLAAVFQTVFVCLRKVSKKVAPLHVLMTAWMVGALLAPSGISGALANFSGQGFSVMITVGGYNMYNVGLDLFLGHTGTALLHLGSFALAVCGLAVTALFTFFIYNATFGRKPLREVHGEKALRSLEELGFEVEVTDRLSVSQQAAQPAEQSPTQ